MHSTVVIASRNPDPHLFRKCLNSLKAQSDKGFKLLIVDDGSSIPIHDSFFLDLQELDYRLIRKSQSIGQGAALNLGINQSKSGLLIRLDDDDILSTRAIEMYKRMYRRGYDLIFLDIKFHFRGKYLSRKKSYNTDNSSILEKLYRIKFPIAHSGIAFSTKLFDQIGGYDVETVGQDLSLFIRLFQRGRAYFINTEYVGYNIAFGSWSQRNSELKRRSYIKALDHANVSHYALQSALTFKIFMFKKLVSRLLLITLVLLWGKKLD